MADLIPRAAAIQICKSNVPNTNPNFYNLRSKAGYSSWMYSNAEACAIANIEIEIEKLPTVDAVPVIRCRDCKYNFENAKHIDVACEWSSDPDFYCAAGERRDGDD